MGGGIKGTDIGLSKQASIFICPINKHKDIISMNNVQGQAAIKACKKRKKNLAKKQTNSVNMWTVQEYK